MRNFIFTLQWIINLFLRIPIVILAGVLHALSDFFGRLAERIDQIEEMIRALVVLPAVKELEKDIKENTEKGKIEALRQLKRSIDK